MNPKKSNSFYKPLSEELGVNEELVEVFISYYYKEIKQHLTELIHPRINVEGLGHFNAMYSVVTKGIVRCEKSLVDHDTTTFKAYHNKKSLEIKLVQLKALAAKISKEIDRKKQFKTKKK